MIAIAPRQGQAPTQIVLGTVSASFLKVFDVPIGFVVYPDKCERNKFLELSTYGALSSLPRAFVAHRAKKHVLHFLILLPAPAGDIYGFADLDTARGCSDQTQSKPI